MAQDLRTFLKQVQETRPGDLIEVAKAVSVEYETLALVEKLEKQGRFPALMFRNVTGHKMPVLVNLTASYERLALAMGTDMAHMVDRFAQLAAAPKPLKWVERADAPVKEVVLTGEAVDLSLLPVPVHNELDAGPYLCSGVALVKHPDTGAVNGGVYRHQVQGRDQIGWVVNRTNHGNYIRRRYDDLKRPMDVAIVIGHHPALLLAGASKLGGIGGELEVTGGLMGEPLEVVKGETVDLPIPARAEIVIEGREYPGQRHGEGPFGEWPRYYTSSGDYPFVKVTAITMRRGAIYQDLAPSMAEHQVLGALPRMGSLLKHLREVVPTVVNVNLPLSGGGRTYCYVSMRKSMDGEPKRVGFAVLAVDPNIREVVVVDDDIDVMDERQVLWARATRFQADKDLAIIPYAIGAILNPMAYDYARTGKGSLETKLIFDATMPLPRESFPRRTRAHPDVVARLRLEDYIGRGS